MQNRFGEKCAVFGIFNTQNEAANKAYFGLFALQHRGQEQSGITSSDGVKIYSHKGQGLVSNVFTEKNIRKLKGSSAIGHNRYSTSRGTNPKHAQPIIINNKFAFAHNGNLPSTKMLVSLLREHKIETKNNSDSELMAKAIGVYVKKGLKLFDAIEKAYPLFTGAFSCVALSKDELVAFRDRRGIRPLVLGRGGKEIVVASETCAFRTVGADLEREIEPGEILSITKRGINSKKFANIDPKFDIFEFVYFSRHDCMVLGKSVYQVRKNFGRMLYKQNPKLKIDIIVPVPETAIPAAIGYSEESGVPFELALNKNRYINRTFIEPSQKSREEKLKMKLSVMRSVVKGKRIGVIDDSIVRGTTSKPLVKMLFDAGAKEVHFMVSSAPVKFPDFYGIDTPGQDKLIASQMPINEIGKFLGATSLTYLTVENMVKATGLPRSRFCLSAFTGEYPLPIFEHEKEINYECLKFKE